MNLTKSIQGWEDENKFFLFTFVEKSQTNFQKFLLQSSRMKKGMKLTLKKGRKRSEERNVFEKIEMVH